MCGPIAMLIGAIAGSAAMGMSLQPQAAAPPAPALPPAITAPTATVKEAEVKLGSDPDGVLDTRTANKDNAAFQRRRVTANTFGNLGKSALTI